MKSEKVYMYGKHALLGALSHAPHILKKVFLADTVDEKTRSALKNKNIPISPLKGEVPKQITEEASHQGIIALIDTSELMQPLKRL